MPSQLLTKDAACYAVPVVRGSPNPRHWGLARRLRTARQRCKLTRMALAAKGAVSEATVLYVENAQRVPTVDTIARLASALSMSAAWLAFGLGEQDSPTGPASCDGMGDRLLSARTHRNQTRTDLARVAELNPGTISKIESGGTTGVDTLEKLSRALRVSPAWLAFGIGPRELPPRRKSRTASAAESR